jgi:predicted RNA-binding Zn ribbon-like protein
MSELGTHAGNLRLVGGRLCLDFANTFDWNASEEQVEWFTGYEDLIAWARHVGMLSDFEGEVLLQRVERDADAGQEAVVRAIDLRKALYRIFTSIISGSGPAAADLATFNGELRRSLGQAGLLPEEDGSRFGWQWSGECDALDQVLLPVVLSAVELLSSPDVRWVKQCAGDACGWLFLDTSRNHTRRWCSMESCGNRAKARRYFRRHQAAERELGPP